MQKNVGIIVGVIIIVLLVAVFWMFRGRPAGETQLEVPDVTVSDEITPVVPSTGAPSADGQPASNVPVAVEPLAVSITATGFTPAEVTVQGGGAVSFTNDDTQSHQVASAPHPVHTTYPPLNGEVLAKGETHTVTFTQAGSFRYHDHLNPGLTGVVVQ